MSNSLHHSRYESSMEEWVCATCKLLSSNTWPASRPLCVDMSSGWCFEYRDQGLSSILEALSKNSTVGTFKLKNLSTLTSEQRDSLANVLKNHITLASILIENVRDSGSVCLSFPSTLYAKTSNLEELMISRCRIDKDGCLALGNATIHSKLRSLQLSDIIFEDGIRVLSESLEADHNTLERLTIANTRLSSTNWSRILDAISKNKSLSSVTLENLNLGDDEAVGLFSIVQGNHHLKALKLPSNNVGSDATTSLANGLATNTSLRTLSLACNPVGDEGAMALLNVLTNSNTTLKDLDVSYCEIWDAGCLALATGLAEMRGLTRLGLAGNDLEQCAAPLIRSVIQNTNIEQISAFQAMAYNQDEHDDVRNGTSLLWKKVERFLWLNRDNRRSLLVSPGSLPLWPHVLASTNKDADMVLNLISSMPSIVQT